MQKSFQRTADRKDSARGRGRPADQTVLTGLGGRTPPTAMGTPNKAASDI